MAARRAAGNRIRGPQSALTDFLAANNISAQQIRDDYNRRLQAAQQNETAAAGPSTAVDTEQLVNMAEEDGAIRDGDDEDDAIEITDDEEEDDDEELTKLEKQKIKNNKSKAKAKKAKEAAKKKAKKHAKKKRRADDDDDFSDSDDTGLGNDMYRKVKKLPGQLENCELCSKRFTVTPYSKSGPEGGLLCTPCGKNLKKEEAAEKKKQQKKPVGRKRRKVESERLDGVVRFGAKSLQDLCINTVAKHHADVEEFGDMPDRMLARLAQIFGKRRVMNTQTLQLFLRPDLDTVVVHEAANLETEDYNQIFAVVPDVKKLVLNNCCQFKDRSLEYMMEKANKLEDLQLFGANLITNDLWQRLFKTRGNQLRTLKLRWLDSAFDDDCVTAMATHCPSLSRIKFEHCRQLTPTMLDALLAIPAGTLEHLSLQLASPIGISDLSSLLAHHGPHLQTLSLEGFHDLQDDFLHNVHTHCTKLSKFRVTGNDTLTDAGFTALFTTWSNSPLTYADFRATRDVDYTNPLGPADAVGLASTGFRALMEHSGETLTHLDVSSCRHIELPAFLTVFGPDKTYPALKTVNVNFCAVVDTTVIAGIFRACPALERCEAFGCFDVTDVVVPRGVALIGVPRAQHAIEQLGEESMGLEQALGMMIEVAG